MMVSENDMIEIVFYINLFYRRGAGASGQSTSKSNNPVLRVDRDEDLWIFSSGQRRDDQ